MDNAAVDTAALAMDKVSVQPSDNSRALKTKVLQKERPKTKAEVFTPAWIAKKQNGGELRLWRVTLND